MRLLLLVFSWPCPCVVMLMNPHSSLPKTPFLIVLFDPSLILLIRSSAFRVKRFPCTSIGGNPCLCVARGKINWWELWWLHVFLGHLKRKNTLARRVHCISNTRPNTHCRNDPTAKAEGIKNRPEQMFVCTGRWAQINLLYEQVQKENGGIIRRSQSAEHILYAPIGRLCYLVHSCVKVCITEKIGKCVVSAVPRNGSKIKQPWKKRKASYSQ